MSTTGSSRPARLSAGVNQTRPFALAPISVRCRQKLPTGSVEADRRVAQATKTQTIPGDSFACLMTKLFRTEPLLADRGGPIE